MKIERVLQAGDQSPWPLVDEWFFEMNHYPLPLENEHDNGRCISY